MSYTLASVIYPNRSLQPRTPFPYDDAREQGEGNLLPDRRAGSHTPWRQNLRGSARCTSHYVGDSLLIARLSIRGLSMLTAAAELSTYLGDRGHPPPASLPM